MMKYIENENEIGPWENSIDNSFTERNLLKFQEKTDKFVNNNDRILNRIKNKSFLDVNSFKFVKKKKEFYNKTEISFDKKYINSSKFINEKAKTENNIKKSKRTNSSNFFVNNIYKVKKERKTSNPLIFGKNLIKDENVNKKDLLIIENNSINTIKSSNELKNFFFFFWEIRRNLH